MESRQTNLSGTPGKAGENPPARSRSGAKGRDGFVRRLASYGAAAGAAAAGTLVVAQPAQADIIYTPKKINFTSGIVFIDFDGVNEFKISNEEGAFDVNSLWMSANGNQGKVVVQNGGAAALSAGVVIGRGDQFRWAGARMVSAALSQSSSLYFRGNWNNVRQDYLGLAFLINGKTHYGWAEFDVSTSRQTYVVDAQLLGYAYDTVANQSLMAGQTKTTDATPAVPEPGTLGLLALGALGLGFWRRHHADAAKAR
jgi:hypothetical protein